MHLPAGGSEKANCGLGQGGRGERFSCRGGVEGDGARLDKDNKKLGLPAFQTKLKKKMDCSNGYQRTFQRKATHTLRTAAVCLNNCFL